MTTAIERAKLPGYGEVKVKQKMGKDAILEGESGVVVVAVETGTAE